MFDWKRSLFLALRAAIIGGFVGFLIAIVAMIGGGKGDIFMAFIRGFCIFGLVRLGWDAFTKKYPDA